MKDNHGSRGILRNRHSTPRYPPAVEPLASETRRANRRSWTTEEEARSKQGVAGRQHGDGPVRQRHRLTREGLPDVDRVYPNPLPARAPARDGFYARSKRRSLPSRTRNTN
jgi:hypothetical protein